MLSYEQGMYGTVLLEGKKENKEWGDLMKDRC